jgi:MoaD family protein
MDIVVNVRYHNILRRAAGVEVREISLPGGVSVRDALEALSADADEALRSLLFTSEGDVVSYLVVFRNQKLVPHDRFDTRLADGDELKLFPAVSGG